MEKPKRIKRIIPKNYNHISYETRLKFISMIQQQKCKISQTCKLLGIKKSTAKSILREFRRKGKIFRRKSQNKNSQQLKKDKKKALKPQKSENPANLTNCSTLPSFSLINSIDNSKNQVMNQPLITPDFHPYWIPNSFIFLYSYFPYK